ncbi:MAG: type II toxin-antitoxin system HicB family antitoxin [Candidatus Marinimicrobia bacterium]|nr:type II toxin-antitoxin system HicB family antitoxin [Candidatus Neomarinimicrobiota bacterium]MCH8837511.1 type II toxin-antitoxin system HicB family antitoxin [Candidatus Neomarinimicrobiota bacterium]
MQYVVVIEKTEKNYGAYVPDLPGCIAVGDTREETLKLIREAIELHLQSMQADGEPIPPTATTAELVEV